MVNRAVHKELSKLSSVSSTGKTKQPPRKKSKLRGKKRANSKNRNQRRRDASQDARISPAPVAKQERQSRSRQQRRSRVSFSDGRSPSGSRTAIANSPNPEKAAKTSP